MLQSGDEAGRAFVKEGNLQMLITSLMFLVAYACKCSPLLEQPLQSVLGKIRPLSVVLKYCRARRTVTWLGSFAAATPKPIQLWHTDGAYVGLKRPKPHFQCRHTLVNRGTTKGGKAFFRGKDKSLKASQEYPVKFCRAVAVITKGNV